jgi:creatinine amidohydrolase
LICSKQSVQMINQESYTEDGECMILDEMRWPEVGAELHKIQTVILPVGATEEHGPHLPLCTDTLEAVAVAKEVSERRGLFLAPALPYGVCRSTRGFPGTITVGHDALRAFALDLLLSLHDSGFGRVLVLTGHAGGQHMSALEQACQRAVEKRNMRISLVSLFALIDPAAVEARGDGHAGEVETSMLMFLREDLVKGKPEGYFPKRPRFLIKKDVRHLMGNGIMGDPSRASLEKGRAFFEMAVQGVIMALEELESFP